MDWRELCDKKLTSSELELFEHAVEEDYFFEMSLDSLPLRGYVGEGVDEDLILGHTDHSKHYIYPHLHFSIGYNGNQIISANVTVDPADKMELVDRGTMEVSFSYSVSWVKVETTFEDRGTLLSEDSFSPQSLEVHWISIINSLAVVLGLGLVFANLLFRMLKSDFAKFVSNEEILGSDNSDESAGWKHLTADVFRFPANRMLFSAMVGSGLHILVVCFSLTIIGLLGIFKSTKRGSVLAALIIIYSITSCVGGYFGAKIYKQVSCCYIF